LRDASIPSSPRCRTSTPSTVPIVYLKFTLAVDYVEHLW
jgi:hypothetical protein